jgi:nicotinamidase-related amidase
MQHEDFKDKEVIDMLMKKVPLAIQPFYSIKGKKASLIIVDVIRGFCEPGAGNLAPAKPDKVISDMVTNVARLANEWVGDVVILQDTHKKGKSEDPYPPHCEEGSGEEELMPQLQFLQGSFVNWKRNIRKVYTQKKDCINGYIGGLEQDEDGYAYEYTSELQMLIDYSEAVVVVGICTDICVMQLVQSLLSARNHGILGAVKDIVVVEPCCATYDLPIEATIELGLPATLAHPRELTHWMGLYFMQMSGAIITKEIEL